MRQIVYVVLAILCFGPQGVAHTIPQPHHAKRMRAPREFLIDRSKPYVYLEVVGIGPREPMRQGEPKVGIWLRLHNNCIVPIDLNTLSDRTPTGQLQPFDRVVADGPPAVGAANEGKLMNQSPGYPTTQSLARTLWSGSPAHGDLPAEINTSPKSKRVGMPPGYWEETAGTTTINPGENLYFSVPLNQVSENWHIEIPFEFELGVKSSVPSAHNYVALYQSQLGGESAELDHGASR